MGAAIPADSRRRALLALATFAICLLTAACPGSQQHEGPQSGGTPHIDWKRPITFAVQVASTETAARALSFPIRTPQGLGAPVEIFRSSDGVPRRGRVVAFEFDAAPYGRILVVERRPDVPPRNYEAANRHLVETNTGSAHLEIVNIRGGHPALVVTNPRRPAAGIYWLEGTTEFWVTGDHLSRSQVLAIAEAL